MQLSRRWHDDRAHSMCLACVPVLVGPFKGIFNTANTAYTALTVLVVPMWQTNNTHTHTRHWLDCGMSFVSQIFRRELTSLPLKSPLEFIKFGIEWYSFVLFGCMFFPRSLTLPSIGRESSLGQYNTITHLLSAWISGVCLCQTSIDQRVSSHFWFIANQIRCWRQFIAHIQVDAGGSCNNWV